MSLTDCRRAARSVAAAQCGAEAVRSLRPRGVTGFLRSCGPLPVILRVAEAERRLVWRDVTSFALLEPPVGVGERLMTGGVRLCLLRVLDRHWESVFFVGPPVMLLLAALGCVPLRLPGLGIALAVAAVLHVLMFMASVVLWQGVAIVRAMLPTVVHPDRLVGAARSAEHWSLRLCHQVDHAEADRLLGDLSRQLSILVKQRARQACAVEGGRPDEIRVLEPIACLIAGVTTPGMRAAMGRLPGITRPFGLGTDLIMIDPPDRGRPLPRRHLNTASFFFWYVSAVATVLAVAARIVADRERRLCGAVCDGHPASYRDALHWLAQRLLLTDPDSIHPAAPGDTILGWAVSIMGVTTVFVAVVALQQHRAAVQRANQILDERIQETMTRASVLILVTTRGERDAVLKVAREQYGVSPELDPRHDPYVIFRLHVIGGTEISLVQFQSGPYAASGIALGADDLIRQCRPDYVVLTGTCFGLREDEQELDDIVVVSESRDLDHKKSTVVDGVPAEEARGHRIPSSVRLIQRFSAASHDWRQSAVHVGPMVSSGTLVNDPTVRSRLKAAHPNAVAGDMECHVLAAAADKHRADWIGVRSISDWGTQKDDTHRFSAATNAASYVLHVINAGLLASTSRVQSASAEGTPVPSVPPTRLGRTSSQQGTDSLPPGAIQYNSVESGATGYSVMFGNIIQHGAPPGSAATNSKMSDDVP